MNTLRTKNGLCAGELGAYKLMNGAVVRVLVNAVERDGDALRVKARVTSPTRYGYKQGEQITLRDTAFLERCPRPGEMPNSILMKALSTPGRSFVWNDVYGGGWTAWDRPPGNARFWTVNGR